MGTGGLILLSTCGLPMLALVGDGRGWREVLAIHPHLHGVLLCEGWGG